MAASKRADFRASVCTCVCMCLFFFLLYARVTRYDVCKFASSFFFATTHPVRCARRMCRKSRVPSVFHSARCSRKIFAKVTHGTPGVDPLATTRDDVAASQRDEIFVLSTKETVFVDADLNGTLKNEERIEGPALSRGVASVLPFKGVGGGGWRVCVCSRAGLRFSIENGGRSIDPIDRPIDAIVNGKMRRESVLSCVLGVRRVRVERERSEKKAA